MTHSRNEGRWSAVPAIGGLSAALLILSSCAREASSPVSPETAVVASSMQSAAKAPASGFTLTVTLAGSGNGMVKSSPNGIACGGTVNKGGNGGDGGNCNGTFSDLVTLTATGIGGSAFVRWSGDACDGSTLATCDVPYGAQNVVATFSKGVYTITVNTNGPGTVTLSPAGVDCGANCFSFPARTEVTLTAAPTAFHGTFSWTGDCAAEISVACSLTVDGPKTVGATFNAATTHTLNVYNNGGNSITITVNTGGVALDPCIDEGQACGYDLLPPGTTVTLTASAAMVWVGCDNSATTATTTCTVTMGDSNWSVKAATP